MKSDVYIIIKTIFFVLFTKCKDNFSLGYPLELVSPLLTISSCQVKEILNSPHHIFKPNFSMLENRLESNQNMYIHVENFTQTTFHLYEDKYPTQAHYKIFILVNESSITMQKCVDLKSCKPMVDCYNGFIDNRTKIHDQSDQILYISWRKQASEIFILAQYKYKFQRCRDACNSINFKKLVMSSLRRQNYSTTKYEFNTLTVESSYQKDIIIPANQSIFAEILQCIGCRMKLGLFCDDYNSTTTTIPYQNGTRVTFSNSLLGYGWNKVKLNNEIKYNTQTCTLNITTTLDNRKETSDIKTYWVFSYCTNRVNSVVNSDFQTDDYRGGSNVYFFSWYIYGICGIFYNFYEKNCL